jgi:hypothetical protein
MLPPYSPKPSSTISILKNTHRQRMVNSEPRKATVIPIHTSSTIQRRLPFEGMMSHKTNHGNNNSKYFPSV